MFFNFELAVYCDRVWQTKYLISTGVAVGAGWQSLVAYVNVGCYYIIGIPVGVLLGRIIHLQVKV